MSTKTGQAQSEGVDLLHRLARGDATALAELGVSASRGFDTASREWGLGKWNGKYILIAGEETGVDWRALEEVEPVAHSHPVDGGRYLQQARRRLDTAKLFQAGRVDQLDAKLILISPADLQTVVGREAKRHLVALPYEHLGGTEIILSHHGAAPRKRPPVTIELTEADWAGIDTDSPLTRRYTANIRLIAEGKTLWSGTVDAVFPTGQEPYLELNAPRRQGSTPEFTTSEQKTRSTPPPGGSATASRQDNEVQASRPPFTAGGTTAPADSARPSQAPNEGPLDQADR